jgi:hypothetical protein
MEKVDGESPARRRPTLRNPVQQVARTDNDDGGFWGCQLGSTEDVGWPLLIGLLIVPSLTRRIKRRHHQL